MPTDENFEIAWDAISDDELFKGIMRDWVRNRNERIAAQRHADRVRGEGITHQFKYGRSMPTTPPTEMTTHESSEDPTAATDTDDSTPPDPPTDELDWIDRILLDDEPTPKIEETKTEPPADEQKLRAEIPVPDEVKQATASEIVSKPPSKEKSPESVEQAMAREAESKPPRSNEEEMAAFAGDRAISDEEYEEHSDSYNKRGGDVEEADGVAYKPLDRRLKTGGGKGEATTPMTDDPHHAFQQHGFDAEIPVLDVRGNPFKAKKLNDWHIKWDPQNNSVIYFSRSDPSHTYNEADKEVASSRLGRNPKTPIHALKASAWYPGKEATVINQKTGEKVSKEFILKDPFANPFHNPNFLETANPEPRNQEYITPVIKSEPLQEQKPDIGFDVVEGDDLSLLPASLFAKNAPGGDDMSLLPSGWKTD